MEKITKVKCFKFNVQLCIMFVFLFCLLQSSFVSEAKWIKTSKGYRYTTNGSGTQYYKNKLVKIKGKYYYFDKNGYRASGFKTIKKKKYYFNKKGVMSKGWIKYNGYYYFADDNGVIQTGMKSIGSYIYYFDSEGKRLTNVNLVFGNLTFYFTNNGTLQYTGTEEEKAMKYINAYRMSKGYAPLNCQMYTNLSYAAVKRVNELAVNASHTRPDGTGYSTVIEKDYPVAVYWSGECILWGKPKDGTVVAANWLSDQNQNILLQKKANAISVARYLDDKGCEYWVALVAQVK